MIDRTIARRYATALFEIAVEKDRVNLFDVQWQLICDTINQDEQLKNDFTGHFLTILHKKELVKKTFSQQLDPLVLNCLLLLFDKGREAYLDVILEAYRQLTDEKNNIINVNVVSAVSIAPEKARSLQESIARMTGKTPRLLIKIDPQLIGGLSMRIGDVVVDGSLAGRLQKLGEIAAK